MAQIHKDSFKSINSLICIDSIIVAGSNMFDAPTETSIFKDLAVCWAQDIVCKKKNSHQQLRVLRGLVVQQRDAADAAKPFYLGNSLEEIINVLDFYLKNNIEFQEDTYCLTELSHALGDDVREIFKRQAQ